MIWETEKNFHLIHHNNRIMFLHISNAIYYGRYKLLLYTSEQHGDAFIRMKSFYYAMHLHNMFFNFVHVHVHRIFWNLLSFLVRKWNIVIVVVTSSTFHFLFLLICQGWNMEIQKMKLKKKKCIDEENFCSYFLARNFFIEFLTSLLNVKWWPYLLLLQVNDV